MLGMMRAITGPAEGIFWIEDGDGVFAGVTFFVDRRLAIVEGAVTSS